MVNAILEDEKGWLWFGTGFSSLGGASIYDGQSWRTITKEDGLAGEKVRSLFLDSASSLWVGSEYDGIALQEEGGWRIYTPDDGLAGWEVKAMLQDSQDNLWLGTEGGLTRIGSSAWRNLVDEGAAPE
jgi:ligand-binding sensor domain-containing protein